MKSASLFLVLGVLNLLAGAAIAQEQVIINPYVKSTPAKKTTTATSTTSAAAKSTPPKSAPAKSTTTKSTTTKSAAKTNGASPAPPVTRTDSNVRLQAKFAFEDALSQLYRTESSLAQRGRIWAETKEEWTDIRIIESNLEKAADLFASGKRHWDAERFEDWNRAWTQAFHALERSRPQLIRIEHMINVRRNQ